MLSITSLNSGSNGNCYYIGDSDDAVLIDAGISCREIEKRMNRLGLSISMLKAVFISHEHTDHISGVEVLAKKYKLPVYITHKTFVNSRLRIQESLIKDFQPHQMVEIGNMLISPFPKFHDAADPHSFVISSSSVKIGVFTDIGYACKEVIARFRECNAVFLESNYDEELLENGKYPYFLKKRIKGGSGHLSNEQALQVFQHHSNKHLSHLILSHLSKENNCPKLVENLFAPHAAGRYISVASRDHEMPLYTIKGKPILHNNSSAYSSQLSLF